MFIAIIGTRFSGKSTIESYLIAKGFLPLKLNLDDEDLDSPQEWIMDTNSKGQSNSGADNLTKNLSLLSTNSRPSPSPALMSHTTNTQTPCFTSTETLLNFVTRNWQKNYVTTNLTTRKLVEYFIRRPFFFLINCDAPLLERFKRSESPILLETFIHEHDRLVFGSQSQGKLDGLQLMADLVNIHVMNTFPSVSDLHAHLESLDLLDPEHLRPSWDAYFMTLASLASHRSNCMKRRVGAVLVRDNRIIATGYNGTARGLTNCNEGGCPQCNASVISSVIPNECVCLHAEENALLEAGRERVGKNCVLYCNTCPCLRCTVKIIQTGVKTVVYNLTYKVDDASASLFREAGVLLRRFDPSRRLRLPAAEDEGIVSITSDLRPDSSSGK